MLGLVMKKLIRKKPPKITNKTTSGKLRPISENDNKNKYTLDTTNEYNNFNINRFHLEIYRSK